MESLTVTKEGMPIKMGGNIPRPEKMFFYRRPNGTVFSLGEQAAAKIHRKFEFIGVTDGVEYAEKLKKLQEDFKNSLSDRGDGTLQSTMTKADLDRELGKIWEEERNKAEVNKTPPILRPINLNHPDQVFLKGFRGEKFDTIQ